MCPRCADENISELATSPVPGAWKVLRCDLCLYTWRTSEPARRSTRQAYPERFRMSRADIDNAPQVPAIPELRADAKGVTS